MAVMMSCRGSVTIIKHGGAEVKGAFGSALEAGDVIKTGDDAQAEILFEDGKWIEIGSKSSMKMKGVKTSTPSVESKEKSFQVVQNFLKLKDSSGTSSMVALRSGGKPDEIKALSPCQTRIRGGKPQFKWRAPDTGLRLTIYDENGVFWKQDIRGSAGAASYPQDSRKLSPGVSYSWTLETTDPLQIPPLRSKAVFFEIISPEEEKALDAALKKISRNKTAGETGYHLMRASVFYNLHLLDDSIEETRNALAVNSNNPVLRSILARLYTETGRTDEALDEFNRLLDKQ